MATPERVKTRAPSRSKGPDSPQSDGTASVRQSAGLRILALCAAAFAASCCGKDEDECAEEKTAVVDAGVPDAAAEADAASPPDAEMPVPVCETEERVPVAAPKVTVGRHEKLDATLLRVFFTVGDFDQECAGPVRVRCRAKIQRPDGSNDPWARPETTEDFLEGEAIIDEPGEVHWDFGMKADEHVTSYQLETTDAAGNKDFSTPVVCDAC